MIIYWLREVGRGERKENREQVTGRSGGREREEMNMNIAKGKKLRMIKIYSSKWQSSHSKSLSSHCISHNPLLRCPPPTPTGEFPFAILFFSPISYSVPPLRHSAQITSEVPHTDSLPRRPDSPEFPAQGCSVNSTQWLQAGNFPQWQGAEKTKEFHDCPLGIIKRKT